MKVTFRQSGGFAGLLKACELDSQQMEQTRARELERLVEAGEVRGNEEKLSATGRDLQEFEITIETEKGTAALRFDERAVPARIRPLLKFLKQCARPDPAD